MIYKDVQKALFTRLKSFSGESDTAGELVFRETPDARWRNFVAFIPNIFWKKKRSPGKAPRAFFLFGQKPNAIPIPIKRISLNPVVRRVPLLFTDPKLRSLTRLDAPRALFTKFMKPKVCTKLHFAFHRPLISNFHKAVPELNFPLPLQPTFCVHSDARDGIKEIEEFQMEIELTSLRYRGCNGINKIQS